MRIVHDIFCEDLLAKLTLLDWIILFPMVCPWTIRWHWLINDGINKENKSTQWGKDNKSWGYQQAKHKQLHYLCVLGMHMISGSRTASQWHRLWCALKLNIPTTVQACLQKQTKSSSKQKELAGINVLEHSLGDIKAVRHIIVLCQGILDLRT